MKKGTKILKLTAILALFAIVTSASKSFFALGEISQKKKKASYVKAPLKSTISTKKTVVIGDTILVKNGESIQKAVQKAKSGDLIKVYPGLYPETVFIDKDNISLFGIIEKGEWPILNGDKKLNDAFLYSGNGISIENFKIVNYKGNAIMGQAGNNFKINNNWVIDAGVYGIFPQYGKNGVIEHNILSGIEDAAIYVGMCDNVDVRHNEVFDSVAGIEIENSRHCIVENNYAHDNTGGILAFVTPGLPIKTTFDVIIRNNFIVNNNHVNFGAPGSLVASIPAGTGILIMAADDVIVENNIITGNNSAGITIVDLATGASTSKDPNSEPNPDRVVILDNNMFGNGNAPTGDLKTLLLFAKMKNGVDIVSVGGGKGSTIKNKSKFKSIGLEKFGKAKINDTKNIKTYTLDYPVESKLVSKKELGSLTYYGVCAGCHAYDTRLIGVPTNIIQMIYKGRPKDMVKYINKPLNLRDDYPEMPPQNYLSEEAKLAVAEYILTLKQ